MLHLPAAGRGRTRTDLRVAALLVLVLLSGGSGLVFEILWIRGLGLWFGNTVPAIATVLAAFMGGLALGNLLFGRRADRHPRPLRLYRWLELGIGVGGIAVALLVLHGGPLLLRIARFSAESGELAPVLRFAIAFSLMLVPTTLMGGTLPVVVRALVRTGVEGKSVGAVYAANTLGAVGGVLLPDLLLIPGMGLTRTAFLAGAVNLAIAYAAGYLDTPATAPARPRQAGFVMPAAGPAVLFGVSGFCAMGYEIVWSRISEHLSGRIITFSVLLAVFLAAVSAGSWLATAVADRVQRPLAWAGSILAGTGVAAFASVVLIHLWRPQVARLVPAEQGLVRLDQGVLLARSALHSLFLAGLPCLLMGAAFPFLAAAAVSVKRAGEQMGGLVAVNTLAGVAGATATGFFLVPRLGAQTAMSLLCLLAALVGGAAVLLTAGRRIAALPAVLAVPALAVAGLWLDADHLRSAFFHRSAPITIDHFAEGATTTIAVGTHYVFDQPYKRELMTPGVSMSSTSYSARRYMGLMGHLPLFLRQGATDALLICYGIGNTASSLLSHPDLERLDVVEISREVLEASRLFERSGSDPLIDRRTRVIVDDGRHHLLTTARRYDVLTAEPPPPGNAGVVNLYSREFYRAARRTMKQGGVVAQWLPVHQLLKEDTLAIVAAFVAEFPHTALFYGQGYQWILIGSDQPLSIDPVAWTERAGLPGVSEDLRGIGIQEMEALVAAFLQRDAGLRAVTEAVEPLNDDRPSIQYPRRAVGPRPEVPEGLVGTPHDVLGLIANRDWFLAAPRRALAHLDAARQRAGSLEYRYLAAPELRELVYGTKLRLALSRVPGDPEVFALLGLDDDIAAAARRSVESGTSLPEARFLLARRAFYASAYEEAETLLGSLPEDQRRRAAVPEATYWLLRGGSERALGKANEAAASLRRAVSASRDALFREEMERLIPRVGESWPAEAGPLADVGGGQ